MLKLIGCRVAGCEEVRKTRAERISGLKFYFFISSRSILLSSPFAAVIIEVLPRRVALSLLLLLL